MIPAAAVAAAVHASFDSNGIKSPTADMKAAQDDHARAILEAAAPILMAHAWEDGYRLGYSDHAQSRGYEPRERNPYRKPTSAV